VWELDGKATYPAARQTGLVCGRYDPNQEALPGIDEPLTPYRRFLAGGDGKDEAHAQISGGGTPSV